MILNRMTMLTALVYSNLMPLHCDNNLIQHPSGSLDTNQLSLSTSASSPDKTNAKDFALRLPSAVSILASTVDSAASFTNITNETFVVSGSMAQLDDPVVLDGIASGIVIDNKCQIQYGCTYLDEDPCLFETEAEFPTTLLSPQAFLHQLHLQYFAVHSPSTSEDHFKILGNRIEVQIDDHHHPLKYDSSFLPHMQKFKPGPAITSLNVFQVSVLNKLNKNLTASQKVWLNLHSTHDHPSFSLVQQLAASGYLDAKSLDLIDASLCEACNHGKCTRKPAGSTRVTKNSDVEGSIMVDAHGTSYLSQNKSVFHDRIISVYGGCKFHAPGPGSEADHEKYSGTCYLSQAKVHANQVDTRW